MSRTGRLLALLGILGALLPYEIIAQTPAGHVWAVNELRAHSGQEASYSQAIRTFELPLFDELIRTGFIVSYKALLKRAGNMQNGTHIFIVEYASWDNYINADQQLDAVSRRLFNRSRAEVTATEYAPKREVIRREVYLDLPVPM